MKQVLQVQHLPGRLQFMLGFLKKLIFGTGLEEL